MKKLLAVLILLLAVVVVYQIKAEEKAMKKELVNIEEQSGLPRIINFGSDCPHCQELIPILNEIKGEYQTRIVVQFIDISSGNKLIKKYSVLISPTLIFLDKNNNELYRHIGHYNKQFVEEKIEKLGMI